MKKYRLISKKGEGTFSEVIKAQSIKTSKYYAIKCMKSHFKNIDQVNNLREIQALRRVMPHPNIVRLEEVLYDKPSGRLALVFELMDMNLYELIRGRKHHLDPKLIKIYAFQALRSLAHLHSKGIFHRDIKPENILIESSYDVYTGLKLADFGSCRGIRSKQPFTEYISTRWYRGPECLLTDGWYGFEMDTWGLGCVLFEISSLFPLFPGENEKDQVHKIHKVLGTPSERELSFFRKHQSRHMKFNFPPTKGTGIQKLAPHLSESFVDLLYKLLAYDPRKRISAEEALQHPYFDDVRKAKMPPEIQAIEEKHRRRDREKTSSSKSNMSRTSSKQSEETKSQSQKSDSFSEEPYAGDKSEDSRSNPKQAKKKSGKQKKEESPRQKMKNNGDKHLEDSTKTVHGEQSQIDPKDVVGHSTKKETTGDLNTKSVPSIQQDLKENSAEDVEEDYDEDFDESPSNVKEVPSVKEDIKAENAGQVKPEKSVADISLLSSSSSTHHTHPSHSMSTTYGTHDSHGDPMGGSKASATIRQQARASLEVLDEGNHGPTSTHYHHTQHHPKVSGEMSMLSSGEMTTSSKGTTLSKSTYDSYHKHKHKPQRSLQDSGIQQSSNMIMQKLPHDSKYSAGMAQNQKNNVDREVSQLNKDYGFQKQLSAKSEATSNMSGKSYQHQHSNRHGPSLSVQRAAKRYTKGQTSKPSALPNSIRGTALHVNDPFGGQGAAGSTNKHSSALSQSPLRQNLNSIKSPFNQKYAVHAPIGHGASKFNRSPMQGGYQMRKLNNGSEISQVPGMQKRMANQKLASINSKYNSGVKPLEAKQPTKGYGPTLNRQPYSHTKRPFKFG